MTTDNPAVPDEESVPVQCARCGETVTTVLNAWRHQEEHVDADRAMLRPEPQRRRGDRESKFSLALWPVLI